ncbi:hypothetical protein B296_00006546, partial [Ensete ventricosum]
MSVVDSFFLLGAEARGRFLQIAGCTLGCTYICTWTPLHHPPVKYVIFHSCCDLFLRGKQLVISFSTSVLISTDGWHREKDSDLPSSSSGSISLRLFEAYRGSFCSIRSGYVFPKKDKINQKGEIELGLTMSPDVIYLTAITCLGGGGGRDFMGHSRPGNLILPPELDWPSPSSSSLRSSSAGSPESSHLLLTKAGAPFVPEAITGQPLAPSHQMPMQAYNPNRNVRFPAATGDDEAMRRAMLAVICLPSSSSSPLRHHLDLQQHQIYQRRIDHQIGAFKAYDPALAPKPEANQNLPGQRMIKTGINILTKIRRMRMEPLAREHRPPSNQLHHMISERRRRKKINDHFLALRLLLPPGSKKDNVSVLANTKTYLNSLKARLSELEEKNQMLERQLKSTDDADEVSDPNERVEVQISRSSEFKSEAQQINLRLTVREECDMIDLVLHALRHLKETRDVILISMDASTRSPSGNIFARANLKLQVK